MPDPAFAPLRDSTARAAPRRGRGAAPRAALAAALACALAACGDIAPTAPGGPRLTPPRAALGTSAPEYGRGRWTVATLFEYQPAGGRASEANAINEGGQVAGASTADGARRAFRAAVGPGELVLLGGAGSNALGIDDAGQVAGVDGGRAVRWEASGAPVALPAVASGQAHAINGSGVVVGTERDCANANCARLWAPDGSVTLITRRYELLDNRDGALAVDVNEGGTVLVRAASEDRFDVVSYLWTAAGGFTRLACPGNCPLGFAREAAAQGLNDAGVVVGAVSQRMDGSGRAVFAAAVWPTPDTYRVIGPEGSRAEDVNNAGTIVGASGGRPALWLAGAGQPSDLLALACADGGRAPAALCAPGVTGVARGINERGQVVGSVAGLPDGAPAQAVVWTFAPDVPPAAPGPLVSAASGKCLDVLDASREPGAAAVIYPCHGGANQAIAAPPAGGAGELRVYGDACLAAQGAGGRGAPVVLAACTGATAQRWSRTTAGELRSADGLCLDVAGWSNEDLTPTILWDCHGGANQRWSGAPPAAAEGALVSAASGKCLDVLGVSRTPGTELVLYDCHGGPNQAFTLPAPGVTGEIRVYGGALCVDAAGGSGSNGDRIVVWDCHGGPNQQWTRTAAGELRGINGRCLDVAGWSNENLTPIILWDCHGGANQRWAVAAQTVATR